MGVSGHVPAHADEAVGGVELQAGIRREAAFYGEILRRLGCVVGPAFTDREESLEHLGQGLHAHEGRLNEELGDIRPLHVTIAGNKLTTEKVGRA